MNPRQIWDGTDVSSRLARLALTPASWLYAMGWQTYLGIYRVGFKKPSYPHQPILCVGNLVTGGSGKSPVVLHIARLLLGLEKSVVIGCSGYGSPRSEAATIAPEGPLDPAEWGDEPAMIRWLLPEIPLVVGRRRVLAAELVHEHFPDSVLLMDDGFQHLPLQKTVSMVLDPQHPENTQCLPAGPYREPRFNRRRADLVLPGEFRVESLPPVLKTPDGLEVRPGAYSVLCGLGQPERFISSLAHEFGPPSTKVILPDHAPMSEGNLLGTLPAQLPIVVTAKDWVKLRQRPDVDARSFLVAQQTVTIQPAAEFLEWLKRNTDV